MQAASLFQAGFRPDGSSIGVTPKLPVSTRQGQGSCLFNVSNHCLLSFSLSYHCLHFSHGQSSPVKRGNNSRMERLVKRLSS